MKTKSLLAIVSTLAFSLTACQSIQKSPPTQKVSQQPIEQKQLTFDTPLLQEPILQQELKFDKPIIISKEPMALNEQLEQYNWQLTNAVDSKKQTITALTNNPEPVVLNFTSNKMDVNPYQSISFSVGCNSMSGGYQLEASQLSVSPIMSTKKYCKNMSSAESKIMKLMDGNSNVTFNHQVLTQTTANGSTLTWQGTLTDEAKYGKSETIFLEIAEKMEPCSSGINQQCLKVREVYYNDNWIQSGYSEWRLMKQPIEGYSHDPKTSNTLRVKKYITDPIDVKGKQLVYVLDMVVETGVVK